MTFYSAARSLRDGEAIKTSSMAGYVYRNAWPEGTPLPKRGSVGSEETAESAYLLGFQERSDVNPGTDGDSTSTYVFYVAKFGDGSTVIARNESSPVKLDLDGSLLAALLSDDWSVSTQHEYDQARKGSGRW